MQSSVSGFRNAPVSKGLLLITGATSVLGGMTNLLPHIRINNLMEQVVGNSQVWRLATHHFIFTSPGELLFGLILLYYFRLFERLMGSAKFGGFVFLSLAISTLVQLGYLALFQPTSEFVSGPYGLLFACFVLFYRLVPASSRFRFIGANLSDKFFVYVLGLQLLFSHTYMGSVVAGASGVMAGLAYLSPALPLQSFQLPRFVNALCSAVLLPLLHSSPSPSPSSSSDRQRRQRARQQRAAAAAAAAAGVGVGVGGGGGGGVGVGGGGVGVGGMMHHGAAVDPMMMGGGGFVEPSEEAIQELTAMGFERTMVVQALRAAHNDPTVAADLLLRQYQ